MGLIGTLQDLLHARTLLDVDGAPSPATGPDDRHGVVTPGPVDRIRPVVDRTDSPVMLQAASFTVDEWVNALRKRYPSRFPNTPRKVDVGIDFELGDDGVLTVKIFDR